MLNSYQHCKIWNGNVLELTGISEDIVNSKLTLKQKALYSCL